MFMGCISLIRAPNLPAKTLVNRCYESLFSGCNSLTSIKVNFTEWNTSNMLSWVYGISPNGVFIKPSLLSEEYGKDRIPSNWEIINI